VRRGLVSSPDDDVQAHRYLHLDERLGAEGFEWYEVSNWARRPGSRCRHNLLYWRNDHWWGIGPGAHSHIGGIRWWNVRHPAEHARLVSAGTVPSEGRETCSPAERELEDLMLGLRLADGFRLDASPELARSARATIEDLVKEGLLDPDAWKTDARLALTRSGRLLTDSVLTRLISDGRRVARGCVASPHAP
jgi:coproporphyrinogen III oxidase-like Fe-S oxidoreductase